MPIRHNANLTPLSNPIAAMLQPTNKPQPLANEPTKKAIVASDVFEPVFIPTPSTSHQEMWLLPPQPVTPWLTNGQAFTLGILSGSAIQLAWQWVQQNKPNLLNAIATKANQEQQLLAIYEKNPAKAKTTVSAFIDQITWKIHTKAMNHCGLPPIPLAEIQQAAKEGMVDSFINNRIARLLITLDDSTTTQQIANVVASYHANEKKLLTSFNQQVQQEVAKTQAENIQQALAFLGLPPLKAEALAVPEKTTLAIHNLVLQQMGEPPVISLEGLEPLAYYVKMGVDDLVKAVARQELFQQTEAFWKVLLTKTFDIDGDTFQLTDTQAGQALLADWA